ncbi:MAG TPA: imidazole glycerol phosphate synthase subunit HisF [Erysipelotrichaceae bacterium]|nr:imidazole glycerol phosphate synthase subunit HisF [Erysipelotrichaceae bacterium]HCY06296.1 imidazole glycerol phosphate synthase subunit HisF [Erysipelotrichaceae bacterium]
MSYKRIIPCLDVKDGKVVKGVNFVGLKEIGSPVELASKYCNQGADELVFLDISATNENRKTILDVVKEVAEVVSIPFTVGGGIKTIEDIENTLKAGADKVSLGSIIVKNPDIVNEASNVFGSDKIVAAIDVKKSGSKWNVYINGGKTDTGIDVIDWVKEVQDRGVGEILLTSMDGDGTKDGYDIDLLTEVKKVSKVPVIASGGCGSLDHIIEVFKKDVADAALAASLFHYDVLSVNEVKEALKENGIDVK